MQLRFLAYWGPLASKAKKPNEEAMLKSLSTRASPSNWRWQKLSLLLRLKAWNQIPRPSIKKPIQSKQGAITHHRSTNINTNMPVRFISSHSESDGHTAAAATATMRLFGRHITLHEVFGGGKVADIVLWRNKHLSAAILAAVSAVWFLFEVVGYNLLTLICHISIAAMLVVFIWSNGAALLDRTPPKIPEITLSEQVFRNVVLVFQSKLNHFLSVLQYVAVGKDLRLLLLVIGSLWMISVVGNSCSSLNLIYFGYLCIQILPALYELYEGEVDHLATKGIQDLRELYRKFDTNLLNKIPRGPIKEKKHN